GAAAVAVVAAAAVEDLAVGQPGRGRVQAGGRQVLAVRDRWYRGGSEDLRLGHAAAADAVAREAARDPDLALVGRAGGARRGAGQQRADVAAARVVDRRGGREGGGGRVEELRRGGVGVGVGAAARAGVATDDQHAVV